MKKLFIPMSIGLAAVLLAGCAVDLSLGGGKKDSTTPPTIIHIRLSDSKRQSQRSASS